MGAIEQRLARHGDQPSGRLRVTMPLLCTFFVPVLKRIMQRYPAIELDMDFSDYLVDVIEDAYDVAIRTGKDNDSRLVSKLLGSYQLLIVGSPEYFALAGTPQVSADLQKHVCMHHKSPTIGKLEPWPLVGASASDDHSCGFSTTMSSIQMIFAQCGRQAGILRPRSAYLSISWPST